jgi:hypothetical protein
MKMQALAVFFLVAVVIGSICRVFRLSAAVGRTDAGRTPKQSVNPNGRLTGNSPAPAVTHGPGTARADQAVVRRADLFSRLSTVPVLGF